MDGTGSCGVIPGAAAPLKRRTTQAQGQEPAPGLPQLPRSCCVSGSLVRKPWSGTLPFGDYKREKYIYIYIEANSILYYIYKF